MSVIQDDYVKQAGSNAACQSEKNAELTTTQLGGCYFSLTAQLSTRRSRERQPLPRQLKEKCPRTCGSVHYQSGRRRGYIPSAEKRETPRSVLEG